MSLADVLPPVIWALGLYAWLSAAVLVRAAYRHPRIGALSERAVVALAIALFGTAYGAVVFNAEVVRVFDTQTAMVVVRVGVVMLLCLPAWWSWMYVTGRLGGDE